MTTKTELSDLIPVEAVQERDTDLLFLEELKCNYKFRDWFLSQTIGSVEHYDFVGAWHSLSQVSLGESDLAFKIKTDTDEIIFLLENKIDANFQPDQAKRYKQRGQRRKENKECDRFYTVLLAPKKYIVRNDDFNFYVEYEQIRDWFHNQTDLGDRAKYKADLLEIAIEKLRRGYTPIVDESTTSFWWAYYNYANENYPHLKMKEPASGIPKGSNFFIFQPVNIGLEKLDQILHKGYGAVDLQLAGKGDQINELLDRYSVTLSEDMEIVKASKSASVRITVDKIDVSDGFNNQLDIISKALDCADKLYHWAKNNLKEV